MLNTSITYESVDSFSSFQFFSSHISYFPGISFISVSLAFSSFRCVSKPCPPAIFCNVSAPLFCLQCLSVATQQCPAFFLQHLFSATLLHCFSSNIYLAVFSYNDLWCLLIFFLSISFFNFGDFLSCSLSHSLSYFTASLRYLSAMSLFRSFSVVSHQLYTAVSFLPSHANPFVNSLSFPLPFLQESTVMCKDFQKDRRLKKLRHWLKPFSFPEFDSQDSLLSAPDL